jgi:hypothetical protein
MALHTQLGETKKNDLTVRHFFNKVKNLADTLASIGQPLRDAEFTSHILNGLDNYYDSQVEVVKVTVLPITRMCASLVRSSASPLIAPPMSTPRWCVCQCCVPL